MRSLMKPILLCLLLTCILAAGASAEGRTVALIVGIDRYISPSISQLKAAVADAKAFSDALVAYAGLSEDDVKLYISDEGEGSPRRPTKANIALALDWAARAVKAEDTFIFYFAGHGISRWEKSYILPIDANTASANVAAMTALSLDDLKLMLGAVRAAHQIVIMDCCRNDPEAGRGDVDNIASSGLMRDVQIIGQAGAQQAGAKSSSILFSCSTGERAYERTDGKNGVFTHYLVQGLSGKAARGGEITFDDLAYYVEANVPVYFRNEPTFREDTKQTPWHKSEGSGRVVLARTGHRDVVVEPTPTPTAPTTEVLVTSARLVVTGTPDGATLYVDGQEVGKIPMTYTVDLGPLPQKPVEVIAVKAGFRSKGARITLQRNAEVEWRAELQADQAVVAPPAEEIVVAPVGPVTPGKPGTVAPAGDKSWQRPGAYPGEEIIGPDGAPMVWVPPGTFIMGSDRGDPWEQPAHQVTITQGFWLGKFEVAWGQIARFAAVIGEELDDYMLNMEPNRPAISVPWEVAEMYCQVYGLRLPTEAEWEWAARGPEGRTYPWGNQWAPRLCSNWDTMEENEEEEAPPVGSFPQGASWCGAQDMAGSVEEWCSDWYQHEYYAESPPVDPQGPALGDDRVSRGGSFLSDEEECRTYTRASWDVDEEDTLVGFRVCVTPGAGRDGER